jgi:N6-adenosine-specific RNA methylase IME4
MKKYQVILIDPPWTMGKFGLGKDMRTPKGYKVGKAIPCPYPTMSINEIEKLPIKELADDICHLWIWTTNRTLHDTFHLIESWGFKYLNILTFNKPAGCGAWFVNTTQHLLFAYKGKLKMGGGRYAKTSQFYIPKKHSAKPIESYTLIESISNYQNKIELFARNKVQGWDSWGNEVESDIALSSYSSEANASSSANAESLIGIKRVYDETLNPTSRTSLNSDIKRNKISHL